ncbi:MAG: hypothetical protein ACI95C_001623 [Pseudohongiellaceae bacterium]|jgi:uncharacterized protein (TIGR02466 family)
MNQSMLNLFPVPLYKSNLNRKFTQIELDYIKQLLQQNHKAISNYSSKNKRVLDASELSGLRAELQVQVNSYFQAVFNTANKLELKITQSWVTLTGPGESHHEHVHPNSVASGVLYINLAENDGINFFRNEDNQWYEFIRAQGTPYSAKSYFIPCSVGDIVIFPSNIRHGVKEVTQKVERISLAFNTFFEGELGKDEFSNALKLTLS